MAIIQALGHLLVVLAVVCIAMAFGARVLKWLDFSVSSPLEAALYAAGLSFALLEALLFILAMVGGLRSAVVLAVLAAAALLAGREWSIVPELAMRTQRKIRSVVRSIPTLIIAVLVQICLGVDALMAMAPLTGSDAVHYHFTVPKLWVHGSWAPIFWITNSFFVGQGHLLIAFGMLLGSDRISLGLIYAGGFLTTAGLYVLIRRLGLSEWWAWIGVLAFILTPMTYWQMSTSGSPDVWMAFYTTLVVLAAARAFETQKLRWWCLAGFFAGSVAGAKYPGWVLPIALSGCCLMAVRSWKWAACSAGFSVPAGILPVLRNAYWTGDPLFPFLTRWLDPAKVNQYALKMVVADTHASALHRSFAGLVKYPLVMTLNGDKYGVGQYFGPLVLAFAPLLVLALRKGFLARAAFGVWAAVFVSNALTSQMARFLLPVYPLALGLILTGVSEACRRKWKVVQWGSYGTLVVFFAFGLCSEFLYARDFVPVAVGLEDQNVFLDRMAPDYALTSFVNHTLKDNGKVMVFFHQLYYLRSPFIQGRPENSWLMDPGRLQNPEELLGLLRRENVRWVVKAPDYPESLSRSFQALEDQGDLRSAYSADALTYRSFRIYGNRVPVRVTILEVAKADRSD